MNSKKYNWVVAIVYLDENPKIFAVSQNKRGYSLPGGSIENEESLETAICREIEEELGLLPENIQLTKTDLEETFVYDSKKIGRENKQTVRKIFLAKSNKKELKPNDKEVLKSDWYNFDEAISILTWPNAKETLKEASKLIIN